MKILLQNLKSLPYSLDIGDWDFGAMVRPLLQAKDTPGDTVDLGGRVDPWDLNVQKFIRGLVVPAGSTRVLTPVPGGYRVTATPAGQCSITFLEDTDDLVFLFFGSGTSDHKVAVDAADTTPDFLANKLSAGTGITLSIDNPGANEKVRITAVSTVTQLADLTDVDPALGHGKGSIFAANGTDYGAQPVGPDGDVLVADSTQPRGLRWTPIGSGNMPPATQIGQVLYSIDGVAFTTQTPVTSQNGWLVNNEGLLLVKG